MTVSCTGTDQYHVNEVGFPGASFAGTQLWATIEVGRGTHTIAARVTSASNVKLLCSVRLRSAGAPGEDAYLVQPADPTAQAEFLVHPPPFLPDLVEGLLLTGGFAIPISNLHPTRWLENVKVRQLRHEF